MKTLYLLRHAKSSWDEPHLRDHQRPLAPRGRRAAPAIASFMRQEELVPDLVVCSTSKRTRQTWALVEPLLPDHVRVEFSEEIYHGGAHDLLALVHEAGPGIEKLMLIGHNPGMAVLAHSLIGSGTPDALANLEHKFPTAALAVIRFGVDSWQEVARGEGQLEHFVRPKDL